MKKIYALICARSGSKGLKNKNLRKLAGKSLIAHAVLIAKKSKYIKEVFVSTNSKKIANEAKKYGATVPFLRPKSLSGNRIPEFKVWRHIINFLEKHKKLKIDFIASIPTTAPFRNVNDVDRSIKKAITTNSDVVLTVTESRRNPFFNMIKVEKKKVSLVSKHSKKYFRRQDVPVCYDLTTVCYVFKSKFIKRKTNFFDGKVSVIKIPKQRSLDIDDEIDYKIAKLIAKNNFKI